MKSEYGNKLFTDYTELSSRLYRCRSYIIKGVFRGKGGGEEKSGYASFKNYLVAKMTLPSPPKKKCVFIFRALDNVFLWGGGGMT